MDAADPMPAGLGVVVGLKAEARLAARIASPARIAISGATASGARLAAAQLIAQGATHLLSFGYAAGLDATIRPGTLLLPAEVVVDGQSFATDASLAARFGDGVSAPLLHSAVLVAERAGKASLRLRTGCVALDMESGAVALAARAAGLPFAVVRAVCDPAGTTLPPAARLALRPGGGVDLAGVAWSILRRPWQLPALIRLGGDMRRARTGLRDCLARVRVGAA